MLHNRYYVKLRNFHGVNNTKMNGCPLMKTDKKSKKKQLKKMISFFRDKGAIDKKMTKMILKRHKQGYDVDMTYCMMPNGEVDYIISIEKQIVKRL